MSVTGTLIAFLVAIILMVIAISRFKVHPAISILVVVLGLALVIGIPPEKIAKLVQTGFGKTIGSIGIVIYLGCILGKVLEETGAALRITDSTLKLLGEKRAIWAIAFSAALLGIPVFADSVVIVLMPIVSLLALKTKQSMARFGPALYLGCYITHSLVPPTPGPLAGAALLGVDMGQAIFWGVVVSIPAVIAATLYLKTIPDDVEPKEEFIKSAREGESRTELPSLSLALLPILLPILLIMVSSLLNMVDKKAAISKAFTFIGSPIVALLLGVAVSLALTGRDWNGKKVLNDWVEDSLRMSAMPIIVTGLGGALALLISDVKIADQLARTISESGVPAIFIPFLISVLVNTITGSNTLGVMTGAALTQPLLANLGLTPLAAFLACASGAQIFKHGNSSGFWVTTSLSNMNMAQGLRSVGGATAISGVCSFVVVWILQALALV